MSHLFCPEESCKENFIARLRVWDFGFTLLSFGHNIWDRQYYGARVPALQGVLHGLQQVVVGLSLVLEGQSKQQ